VRAIKSRGLVCSLSSNLNVLREPEALLAEHPDYLRVSVSGFTQEIYARGHREGDIEQVKHNMQRLAAAHDAVRSNTHVEVYYHRYADNPHELPLMAEFARSLGFHFASTLAYVTTVEKIIAIAQGRTDRRRRGAPREARRAARPRPRDHLDAPARQLPSARRHRRRRCRGKRYAVLRQLDGCRQPHRPFPRDAARGSAAPPPRDELVRELPLARPPRLFRRPSRIRKARARQNMRERALAAHRRGTLTSWFGYRNIAFIVFIVLLNLYASLAPGSDAAGRVNESAAVTMLWVVVALPFFAVNAVLLGAAFVKERPATKPLIASLLSALSVVVLLID
jgi:hypothetical protein